MKHDARGSWLSPGGHTFDVTLASGIAEVFRGAGVKTVMDIGCGDGSYVQYLNGFEFEAVGYDGNPNTEEVTGGLCHEADFSMPVFLRKHDAVLCLEVGEHIPEKYEGVFLDNVTSHAKKIIVMSWAIPGQGGYGHVNERENGYVAVAMADLGWDIDWELSNLLRGHISNAPWFKDTVMVFK